MISNKKGVSLIAMIIMIIVIIILASIGISTGFKNITKANQANFLNDLKSSIQMLEIYNTRAVARGNVRFYDPEELFWDGVSQKAQNTARIENPDEEDDASYIFQEAFNNGLHGKIFIKYGKIYIKREYVTEIEWAKEMYDYMADSETETNTLP